MRWAALAALVVVLSGKVALAQAQAPPPEEPAWSFSGSLFTYFPPDADTFLSPVVSADRGWLRLAARYNYEDLETGSVWFGYNFSGGKAVQWGITPMIGGVVGTTAGVAPGWSFFVDYWKLELYSESEYVINARDTASSFFYNWSEFSISPIEWLRLGAAIQRTRVYKTDRDVQRGLLLGFSYKMVDVTTYAFNLDETPLWVLAVTISF